jgi:hypothetical protein
VIEFHVMVFIGIAACAYRALEAVEAITAGRIRLLSTPKNTYAKLLFRQH